MFNYVNPLAPVTDFTNLILQGATYGELKTLIGDVMQLQGELGFDDEVAGWLLENGDIVFLINNHSDEDAASYIFNGLNSNHFQVNDLPELLELSGHISESHSELSPDPVGIPRLEYIIQIDKIQRYLELRHTDYGDAAQYLKDLLPLLILDNDEEFTTAETYRVYEIAYAWYSECAYRTLSSVVKEVILAARPFIEFALIETGFYYGTLFMIPTANASWRLSSLLPQPVKNAAQLVWDRISFTSAYRPNTLIPETFTYSLNNGQKIYVQADGTKHLSELVLKNNASSYGWFSGQKALRSQLVLDDFAHAVDDIILNNSSVQYNVKYFSGKWEIIFGNPTPNSNGLVRIYHSLSL